MRTTILSYAVLLVLAMTTTSLAVPIISNVSPVDNATAIILDNTQVYLRANITDAHGLKYIAFQTNKTGTWTTIAEMSLSGNWSTNLPIALSGLQQNTKYWWRMRAESNNNTWTNTSAYSFTTQKSVITGQNITIVPTTPKANKNVVFVVDANDASGYVMCYGTGDVYMVEIKNGVGIVQLGMEYGLAQVNIIGYGTRTFTIASPYSGGVLAINVPYDAQINQKTDLSVTAQGTPIQANVDMTSPTGTKISRITGTQPIQVTFDVLGKWNITATVYDATVTKTIQIMPEPLTITVPDEAKVGEENIITTSEGAAVTLKKGEVSWTYTADDNGEVFFTPTEAGRYEVTASISNQEGSDYFNVISDTIISVKDDQGNLATTIKNGEILVIQVLDKQGNVVNANEITVTGDSPNMATITLSNGIGIWHVPFGSTTYNFDFSPSDTALYTPAQLSISGSPGGVDALYIYIGVAVVVVILVLLYILNNKGIINLRSLLPTKEEDPLL